MIHLIVFLPLAGFLIAGLFGKQIGDKASEYVTSGFLVIAAILSWVNFVPFWLGGAELQIIEVGRGLRLAISSPTGRSGRYADRRHAGRRQHGLVARAYLFNRLHASRPAPAALFRLSVAVHLRDADAGDVDNLIQMFFGWEGVGLASYLLIGFWFKKPSANAAAIKAFVVNRIGDFGFALGIFGVFVLFDSVNLEVIFANAAAWWRGDCADALSSCRSSAMSCNATAR